MALGMEGRRGPERVPPGPSESGHETHCKNGNYLHVPFTVLSRSCPFHVPHGPLHGPIPFMPSWPFFMARMSLFHGKISRPA